MRRLTRLRCSSEHREDDGYERLPKEFVSRGSADNPECNCGVGRDETAVITELHNSTPIVPESSATRTLTSNRL